MNKSTCNNCGNWVSEAKWWGVNPDVIYCSPACSLAEVERKPSVIRGDIHTDSDDLDYLLNYGSVSLWRFEDGSGSARLDIAGSPTCEYIASINARSLFEAVKLVREGHENNAKP